MTSVPLSLPRPSPDVVSQELRGEAVLVHLRTNRIYALNATAARIWELLERGGSIGSVRRQLESEFEVEADRVERDVDDVLRWLRAERLVDE